MMPFIIHFPLCIPKKKQTFLTSKQSLQEIIAGCQCWRDCDYSVVSGPEYQTPRAISHACQRTAAVVKVPVLRKLPKNGSSLELT